ncbi:hypothetical protein Y032_0627g816 [Ancylostoma ceylanicum]|uniref:Uncharacterized protein n=2 Tax=Ancylostoma ceylanicum TaxID=53326 RepID=A0A016WK04_9BILA|nr:hypothetical protein Y032_0627g816 [Ancylostoma ceylanicum]
MSSRIPPINKADVRGVAAFLFIYCFPFTIALRRQFRRTQELHAGNVEEYGEGARNEQEYGEPSVAKLVERTEPARYLLTKSVFSLFTEECESGDRALLDTPRDYSPKKTYFEEKCEENSARIAILEQEILELRRAIEAQMKKKVETKDAVCDAIAPDDRDVEMGNVVQQENIPLLPIPARADEPLGPHLYGRQNAIRKPFPYLAIMLRHFCNQRVFSDSCRNVIGAGQRAEIVKSKGFCPKCLKRHIAPC